MRSRERTRRSGYLVERRKDSPPLEPADVEWALDGFLRSRDGLAEDVRGAPTDAVALRVVLDCKNGAYFGPDGHWDGMFNPRGMWIERRVSRASSPWGHVVRIARVGRKEVLFE